MPSRRKNTPNGDLALPDKSHRGEQPRTRNPVIGMPVAKPHATHIHEYAQGHAASSSASPQPNRMPRALHTHEEEMSYHRAALVLM